MTIFLRGCAPMREVTCSHHYNQVGNFDPPTDRGFPTARRQLGWFARTNFVVRNSLIVFVAVLFVVTAMVEGRQIEMGGMDYALAVRDGAMARLTFRIVDDVGNVVTGANVQVSFGRHDSQWIKGCTDTNGLYTVEGKSSGKVLYDVDRAGYYQTSSEYSYGVGKVMLEDGRWFPWNPTNTVVLKQVKCPVAMYVYSCDATKDLIIPSKGTNVAFDMEKGDWVAPFGKGERCDLIVNCDDQFADPWTGFRKLSLTFGTNVLDGVRRHKLDNFSNFRSLYEAPADGYEKTVTWSIETFRKQKDIITEPPLDEYFIFRIRTVEDENGKMAKANYGKIYGPVQYGDLGGRLVLRMMCYFNPEVNSRNLEFDPKKNLAGQNIFWP